MVITLLAMNYAGAHGSFTSVSFENSGFVSSMENGISGFTTFSDGSGVTTGFLSPAAINPAGIEDIEREENDAQVRIYSLDGIYQGSEFDKLKKGIYLVKQGENVRKIIKDR